MYCGFILATAFALFIFETCCFQKITLDREVIILDGTFRLLTHLDVFNFVHWNRTSLSVKVASI